jgi:hypothetical protein
VGKKGLSEAHILFDSPDAVDKVLMPENLGTLPCEVQPVLLLLCVRAFSVVLCRSVCGGATMFASARKVGRHGTWQVERMVIKGLNPKP